MPLRIPVAHDYMCPWCWIGLSQVKRLQEEFDVEFEWLGYELYPDWMEWPDSPPSASKPETNRPKTPTRFDLAMAAEGLPKLSSTRPRKMRTFRTHQAAEFARDAGVFDAYNERLYRAFWEQGLNINELETLKFLAKGLIPDLDGLAAAVEERRYADRIVDFDAEAYAAGVYNVPTFWIGGERYSEQPTSVLREAIRRELGDTAHSGITLGSGSPSKPFVYINMVSTFDGKIITGNRDEPVMDLGSSVDHATMRHLESLADAVLIGAGSLRATPGLWYDARLLRLVVTESGDLNYSSRFFTDVPERAIVISPRRPQGLPDRVQWLQQSDWPTLMQTLVSEFGIGRLLCEGGSELNASVLRAGVVDEFFLTLAPKLKLGKDVPTVAGGEAFDRSEVQTWTLVSETRRGDELFVRYRRPTA